MPSNSSQPRPRESKGQPILPSSHLQKPIPLQVPKMMPLEQPHYLVVNTTLPSNIFSDRSLFTTYVPSRKSHWTAFGTDIIIEVTGNVHLRVFMGSKSIMFCFRDSWHVPTSPHHFFSCSTAVSLGNQVMIAGRSPQLIVSHKQHLTEPNLPKYMPFTQIDGLTVLKFEIPAQGSISSKSLSTATSTATQNTVFVTCLHTNHHLLLFCLLLNLIFLPHILSLIHLSSTWMKVSRCMGAWMSVPQCRC